MRLGLVIGGLRIADVTIIPVNVDDVSPGGFAAC